MSDKGSEKVQKTDCCPQKDCCPSPVDTTKPQPPSRQPWWKIAVFALGMLMIAGAASYSIITRHINALNTPLDKSGIPQIASSTGGNASNILGLGDLAWVQNLSTAFAKHDFIFVILSSNDDDSTKKVASQVANVEAKIKAEGGSVGNLTLSPSDPEFSTTVERLAIQQLPAVLPISKSGNAAIVTGNFTETDLLQTYLVVSKSSSSCCPSSSNSSSPSSSGCCPQEK